MDVCLLAGELMLKNGAETYRVEDTMSRIAYGYEVPFVNVFVTPTAVLLSMKMREEEKDHTEFIRIFERSIDLHKVSFVNDLSRRINGSQIPLEDAKLQLKEIDQSTPTFPLWLHLCAAALTSGCFTLMFNGGWADFLPAVISGCIGYAVFLFSQKYVNAKFFSEVLASFTIGIAAVGLFQFGIGQQLDKIMIGSVMPLVPGVAITNAVRDLMAGHLIAGLSRGAEAFLTAAAIGTGIAVVISAF